MNEDRFFMAHGVIHDWQTMRHVAADFEEDWQPRLLELLNELENSKRQAIERAVKTMNEFQDYKRAHP